MFCKAISAQKKKIFARRFWTTSKQKCSNVRPPLSITFPQGFRISKNIGHPTSGSGGKKTVKRYLKSEKSEREKKKNLRGDFRQFSTKNVHIWDHVFPLLFRKDSGSLKILDIRLQEVGAKRPVKKTENWRRPKKVKKKTFFLRGDFRQFWNKNVHIWDHFFPLLFPKDSESLKILDIRLREVRAKRPLKKTKNWRRPKKVKKKTFFCAAILDNFQTKMFISETTSFHYFSPRIPNL